MDNTFDEDTEQSGSSVNLVTRNISTGNVSLGLNEREDTVKYIIYIRERIKSQPG